MSIMYKASIYSRRVIKIVNTIKICIFFSLTYHIRTKCYPMQYFAKQLQSIDILEMIAQTLIEFASKWLPLRVVIDAFWC